MAVKIWLLVAAGLVVLGVALFGVVMTLNGWDFTQLGAVSYVTGTTEVTDVFHHISVDAKTADIRFVPSEDGVCKVVCFEEEKYPYAVSVKGETLVVELTGDKKWYEHIGITFQTPQITVYLPAAEYGSLTVENSTGDVEISKKLGFESVNVRVSTGDIKAFASVSGDIELTASTGSVLVENVTADSLKVSTSTGHITLTSVACAGEVSTEVSTGRVTMTDVTCRKLSSEGDTGKLILTDVIAARSFELERSTGDILLERCDAGEIRINTDTGDVKGSLLSEKVFVANTDTGRKDVPKTTSGGLCEITTDTGDIRITIG